MVEGAQGNFTISVMSSKKEEKKKEEKLKCPVLTIAHDLQHIGVYRRRSFDDVSGWHDIVLL